MGSHRNPRITKKAIEQIIALGTEECEALNELRVACRFSVLTTTSKLGNFRYEDLILRIENGVLENVERDPDRD